MSFLNKLLPRSGLSINLLQFAKYSINISNTTSNFIFKSSFTPEEQQKILNILNGSNPEQLASFSVSQTRIKNLEIWKHKKGPFRSLNDVLEVDGLGEKVLEKICENIIKENVTNKQVKKTNTLNKRLRQLVMPPLLPITINNISSAVGIHLGPVGISWAKLSCNQNELSDWASETFTTLPKKLLPTDTFELALSIIKKLPQGDVYVLESHPSISPQASTQASTVISYNQHLELTSMLIALLNTSARHNIFLQKKEGNDTAPKSIENVVYHLRSKVPARLFKTLVGTERVSTLTTVMELVENNGKLRPLSLPCSPITMTEQVKSIFLKETAPNKEMLGQALLLAISFMDMCVYKNPASLSAIKPGKNNK